MLDLDLSGWSVSAAFYGHYEDLGMLSKFTIEYPLLKLKCVVFIGNLQGHTKKFCHVMVCVCVGGKYFEIKNNSCTISKIHNYICYLGTTSIFTVFIIRL